MVVWSMDVLYPGRSYPRRFVPRLDYSYPAIWTFRTQNMDDSYPRAGRFVPNVVFNFLYLIWYFRIQYCTIYSAYWVLVDSYPFLFISHSWFGLFYMYLFTNVWFFSYLTLPILRYERLSSNWVKYSWMTVKLNQGNNNNFIYKWLFEWCV